MWKPFLALLAILAGLASACDSGNPVVPAPPQVSPVVAGQTFTITLTINPTQLVAGSGVAGTITVRVQQSSDGQPPADGTLVTLNTDLGNFGTDASGEIKVEIVGLSGGSARVSLFPGEEVGTANVLATVGEDVGRLQVPFTEGGPIFLTAVAPGSGSPSGGDEVQVRGGGFVEPLRVNFGAGVGSVLAVTSQRITVLTPPSDQPVAAGTSLTVDVKVTAALDQATPLEATLPGGFVYAASGEVVFVTQVSPSSGSAAGGERVSVLGGGFEAPVQVTFGGIAGTTPEVISTGEIEVTVPPPPMPVGTSETLAVDVTVTSNVDQTDAQTGTLPGGWVYRGDAAQDTVFVTQVTPSSGGPTGGETVEVTGGGFASPTRVDFGGVAGTGTTVLSSSRIQVVVPPPPMPVPSGGSLAVDVTVTSGLDRAQPQSGTLPGGYVYQAGNVVVTAISPTEGSYLGDTEVTVTGQGFEDPVGVELAGVRQSAETFVSSTEVRFTTVGVGVEACPASGRLPQVGVTVINLGASASGTAALTFDYTVPRPRIDRVAPSFGPQLGNTVVSLEGAGFASPARVVFVAGGEEFAGVVQSVAEDLVRVASPRLPDSVFPEADCTTGDGSAGKRFQQITADVKLTQTDTGCEDTFANAFTYDPTDTSCRPSGGG